MLMNFNAISFIDDVLLYEKMEHSYYSITPKTHSVTFYFIDNVYITYTRFEAINVSIIVILCIKVNFNSLTFL